jgi:superfamily II DNA or RNA helicase
VDIQLRPFQNESIEALRENIRQGVRNQILSAPTGSGKTVLASYLLDECYNKGSKRAVFVCDRIPLVDQTSAMLDAYGIPHGVIQADHWRHRPWERIQVASAQTLARRSWPDAHLIIVDEAHGLNAAVTRRIGARNCVTIGLTATPFTKGLGRHYEKIVSVTTTNALITQGWLAAYRIFAASEPDMTGAKVIAGEWTEDEAAKRSMPIVGDCVAEYLKHGGEKKFIAFGCTVAHCEEMQRQFLAAGVQCALYTYRTGDDERARMVEEFRKPHSYIRGLISVSALAKGFDVSDVEVIVMARPLRKSLTEFIQMFGRGLRSHPGKEVCTLLDHSGNVLRFWNQMNNFFEHGATELDDGRPKEKKKAKEDGKKPIKCPKCYRVHDPRPSCPHCGYVYPRRSGVSHVAGELRELAGGASATPDQRQDIYSQLLWIVRERGYKPGYAAAKFKARFGTFPSNLREVPKPPSPALLRWIRSEAIAYARSKKR